MEKSKKMALAVLAVLCLGFPVQSYAAQKDTGETPVGIGFKQAQPQRPGDPTPTESVTTIQNNVIPLTTSPSTINRGRLPQTGSSMNHKFQLIGIGCLLLSFWLFIFFRLKREEN